MTSRFFDVFLSKMVILAVFLFVLTQVYGSQVGLKCKQSVTCGTGAYCTGSGICYCLSTFTSINGYCYRKINPGQSGCAHVTQCSSVWPGAYCSRGTCRCSNNQQPFPSREGLICVNYGQCPINGYDTKLMFDGSVFACQGGADGMCPSEMYECICSTYDCKSGTTFCCPTRAFSCIQPPDEGHFREGNGGLLMTRYYFDSIAYACKSFKYRGRGGNANNFRTKDHCTSYCYLGCYRGNPQYGTAVADKGNGVLKASVVTCNTGACASGFYCASLTLDKTCCPAPAYVCSKNGGLPYAGLLPAPSTNYDPGSSFSSQVTTLARFYYDETEKRCMTFNYLGQAGNFNNFFTEADCDIFCATKSCPLGLPLKNNLGVVNVNCGKSDVNCPTSHYCTNTVCCPRKEFVCTLPKEPGDCLDKRSYLTRYWYNAATGNCEKFTYTGCSGNWNNFGSYFSCHFYCKEIQVEPQCLQGLPLKDDNGDYIKCGGDGVSVNCPVNYFCYFDGNAYGCCPSQSYTCPLNYDVGRRCGPAVGRWFYNSTSQRCDTFLYRGCDGNSNNFPSHQDCIDYCIPSACPDGGDILKDSTGHGQTCSQTTKCPDTHICTTVSVRTNIGYQQYGYCCPSKRYICGLAKKDGVECLSSTVTRYFFDAESRTCNTFSYNGCDGNRNNFGTKSACENYCLSEACTTGTIVYQTSGKVVECTKTGATGSAAGCPTGYVCHLSLLLKMNVCCGASSGVQNLCPSDAVPYMNALTQQPLQCQPNVLNACPGDFFCWFAIGSATNSYYCCRNLTTNEEDKTGICPPELMPIMSGNSNKDCSPSKENDCGSGSYCQYADKLRKYICCGREPQKPNVCPPQPEGLTPVLVGSDYRTCTTTASSGSTSACPSGAACLWIESIPKYICCQQTTTTTASSSTTIATTTVTPVYNISQARDCSGQLGFLPVNPFPTGCSPFFPTSCDNFKSQATMIRCLWSSNLTRFICCKSYFNR